MDFPPLSEKDGALLAARGHAQALRTALVLVLIGGGFLALARLLPGVNSSELWRVIARISEFLGWGSLISSTVLLFTEYRVFSQDDGPEPKRLSPGLHSRVETMPREAAIDDLYSELRPLLSRAASDPSLRSEAKKKLTLLRKLQDEEADEIQRRFESSFLLKPGEGRRALERADAILARYEDPSSTNASTRNES